MKSFKLYSIIAYLMLGATSAFAATSITQYGITWTFDKNYTVGQFANGDYYVVDPGSGVVITNVSNEFHAGTDLSTVDYDGTSLNVGAWSYSNQNPTQGWDSRMSGYNSAYNINKHLPYTLTSGNCLCTIESWLPTDPGTPYTGTRTRPSSKVFAILTCMSSDVGSTAFRPSYATGQKTIYYTTDLQTSLLPDLDAIPSTPLLSTVENYVKRPWVDLTYEYGSEYWRPNENFGIEEAYDSCTYQQKITNKYNDAILRLCIDSGDRTNLLYYLVQIGIDYYGLYQNGATWPSDGGHQMGYKFPILFSGLMLNDSGMLAIGELDVNDSSGRAYFQEDGDHFYVDQTAVDITNDDDWPTSGVDTRATLTPYTTDDIGTPEWGYRHSYQPHRDNADFTATYREINSGAGVGTALSALIFGLKTTWNHDAFFDYQDRYSKWPSNFYTKYTYVSQFTLEMWKAYRDGAPYVGYSKNLISKPTNLHIVE
ncbi:hypothetical protein DSCO28_18600 [Desulfosarcina ovata subsp. sediminis]|uniref:Uncharacterized protein n=1 Tax=Desulfosarcina ovata subsp. sediminis TaxID=885957 RepID=A0A5K7ZIR9_9BACT|nr:hypothetical protein [Desulfosarcina ovata]BBO81294.1 hypothetical protein DSCO28_18600 [Desulfosarcina ovata subsp. sediminis]